MVGGGRALVLKLRLPLQRLGEEDDAAWSSAALVAAYARVGPCASRTVRSRAADASRSAGTTCPTRPSSKARVAFTTSPSSSISRARAGPTSRWRVQDAPESGASPMPVNAMENFAVSAATRKSHANASEAPAPAATPFTAATTGLPIEATASTTGL
ncbi:hypothetical protein GCM10027612_80810 [Microbispora bryophytorum subsp. camponoti]